VLSRLGERFEEAFDPSDVLPTLVRTVADSLKLPYVAITMDGSDPVGAGAAVGAPAGVVTPFALNYQGNRIGYLLVCPRRREHDLADADRRLLLGLAGRAGMAVHGV